MPRFATPIPAPPQKRTAAPPEPQRQRQPRQPALAQMLQLRAAASARAAGSGLPAGLKAGVEALSGVAMDDVKVHYGSGAPARLGALAFAQGSDIHLGPGQERHLPHEAWHVVQQKQGRIRPTLQMKSGVPVNDDAGLEREADVMGARAARADPQLTDAGALTRAPAPASAPLQRRAPTTNDVPGTTKGGTATIFDDVRVGYGPIFEKTVAVADHDPTTVIAAYQKAIKPIGNTLAAVSYTDVGTNKFPNGVGAMPLVAPPIGVLNYLMNTVVGVGTVRSWLDVPSEGAMSKLFDDDLVWASVKTKLGNWLVGRELLLDNKYIGLVDPLMVRMTFQSAEQGQQDWEIDTQFADSGKGYIVRIHDGKNNITGTIVTGPDFTAAATPPAPAVAAPVGGGPAAAAPAAAPPPTPARDADDYIYSSTHVGAAAGVVAPGGPGTVPLGTRIDALRGFQNPDTRVGQHDALDAFTLMAAEGARFRPVAELGASAHLNATFFTKPKSAWQDAHGVTLHWLYVNWGARFGSAYDITKETMATVVDAHGPRIRKKPNKPNYNLTTGVMERN